MAMSIDAVEKILNQRQSDCVLVKDHNSQFLNANQLFLSFFGFQNVDQLRGKSDYDLRCANFAPIYIKNDQDTMIADELSVIEPAINDDGIFSLFSTVKYTFIDENTKQKGILGIFKLINYQSIQLPSISLEESEVNHVKISDSLFKMRLGQHSSMPLTNRELDVLYYVFHGLSQKQIADKLDLSVRTVEGYVDHIKVKLKCNNKNQLVEFAIQYGLINIVPRHLLSKLL